MNHSRPVTITCQCGKKIEPFYNPITKRWILPTPPCFDCLEALEKKEEKIRKGNVLKAIRHRIVPLLLKAGVPRRFLNCTLANYQTNQKTQFILDAIARFLKNKDANGLLIFGPTGVGKTHLAVSLAREFLLRGEDVLFRNLHRLFLEIRNSFDPNCDHEETEKSLLDQYKDVPVLILDDLGSEQVSAWSIKMLSMIMNDRYESVHRRLIITSNLNVKEIERLYAPRISSRIIGMCKTLKITGWDYRLKQSPQDPKQWTKHYSKG